MTKIIDCLNKSILCNIKDVRFKVCPMVKRINEFSKSKKYVRLNNDWVRVEDIEFLDFIKDRETRIVEMGGIARTRIPNEIARDSLDSDDRELDEDRETSLEKDKKYLEMGIKISEENLGDRILYCTQRERISHSRIHEGIIQEIS